MKSIQAIQTILGCGFLFFCILNAYNFSLIAEQAETTEASQAAQTLLEDFRSGKPTLGKPTLGKPNAGKPRAANVGILGNTNASATNATNTTSNINTTSSRCIPFINLASDFQGTTEPMYKQSTRLPLWMKEYFDWHRAQTSQINSCNFHEYKYLILRCTEEDKRCGGLSDRLKSIPMFVALAAKYQRIFLIRWNRPTKLEAFLLPHEIDWSFPDWLYEKDRFQDTTVRKKGKRLVKALATEESTRTFVEGFVQDMWGGCSTYHWFDSELDANKTLDPDVYKKKGSDRLGWSEYEHLFRDLFYTLFQPTPEVANLIQTRMESGHLVPGNFSTSHYRAFYAIEHNKGLLPKETLYQKTENAIHCATQQQPGDPIYFASDSQLAVQYARNLSESKGNLIVAFDEPQEALHLDKRDQWTSGNPSDFYPTFVDLLIMGEARCMSHGLGGFGLFANLLSKDPSCVIKHDAKVERNAEQCEWTDP